VYSIICATVRITGSTIPWVKFNVENIVVSQPVGDQRAVVLFSPINKQNL
jgi:hypothetical protein